MAAEEPYLRADPPPIVARASAALMLFCFVIALVCMCTVRVPETVDAAFTLVPISGADPVRSPTSGVVVTVAVAEGQHVANAATIGVILSEAVGDRAAEIARLQLETGDADHRLALSRETYATALDAASRGLEVTEARHAWLVRNLAYLEEQVATERLRAEESRRLFLAGAQSADQTRADEAVASAAGNALERARMEMEENRAELSAQKAEIAGRQAEQAESESAFARQEGSDQSRLALLLADPGSRADNRVTMSAPCAGYVLRLHVSRAGAVVGTGEAVAEVACDDADLRARLNVSEEGSVRLQAGQNVKLYFDAFPYQRYGIRWGSVERVDPVISIVDGVPRSGASATIRGGGFRIGTREQALLPGMGGRAEIVVGSHTIVGHLLASLKGPGALLQTAGDGVAADNTAATSNRD